MSTHRSHFSTAALLRRQFLANRGASVTIAVIALIVTAITAAAPRALDLLFTAELRHQLNSISDTQRDFVAQSACGPILANTVNPQTKLTVEELFAPMGEGMERIRSAQEPPLLDALGEGRYVSTTLDAPAVDPVPDNNDPLTRLVFAFDPRMYEVIDVIDGEEPAVFDRDPIAGPAFWVEQPPPPSFPSDLGPFKVFAWPDDAVVDVTLSKASAARMEWEIGETRRVLITGDIQPLVRLAGVFEAIDPTAAYWQHNESIVEPLVDDDGNAPPTITGTGYMDPLSTRYLDLVLGQSRMHTTFWFPFETDDIETADANALLPLLRQFSSSSQSLGSSTDTICGSISLRSGATEVIEAALSRAGATNAVLAMMAAGPFGVAIAVLALGTRLVIERRRAGLTIAAARGASGTQLRTIMALEGLLLGVPPAILAIFAAVLLLPARVGAESLVLPILIGLTPAVMFAFAASSTRLRPVRNDLDPSSRGRFRWIAEVLVFGLAALSLFLLFRRGLTTSASTVGVDPLLVATPLLLALAVCLVVLRLYPFPLLWIGAALRRRPGITCYLGAVRAVRDPAAGVAPVLAMVVGVSVAVFSGVIYTTLDRGVDAAARNSVGADSQALGPVFSDDQLADIQTIEGVETIVAIDDAGGAALRIDGVRQTVRLIEVDFAALGTLRDGLPIGLDALTDGSIPVIASSDIVEDLESDVELELEGFRISIAGSEDRTTGIVTENSWVMVDKTFARDLTEADFRPRVLLIDLAAGTSGTDVSELILAIGGDLTRVLTPEAQAASVRESPAVVGLQIALLIAIIAAGLLCALAVILTSVVNGPARDRLLTLLRVLGLSPRQSRSIAGWETGPIAITALFAGTVLGLGLPYVVLGSVDVRPFVGGSLQPSVAIDPVLLTIVVVGFSLVVLAALVVAVLVARRVSPATALRMGEGG